MKLTVDSSGLYVEGFTTFFFKKKKTKIDVLAKINCSYLRVIIVYRRSCKYANESCNASTILARILGFNQFGALCQRGKK